MLGQGRLIKSFMTLALFATVLAGCSSNKKKYELRDKIASSSGLFCDFINGDKYKEVEIELNVAMARKCDPDKPYSITGYRNASEVHGMMYCCSTKKVASAADRADKNENSTKIQSSSSVPTSTSMTTAKSGTAPAKPSAKPAAKDAKDSKDQSEELDPL